MHDIYIFNITYVVCYHLARFGLKSSLVHEEIKREIVLMGKSN
jgi:hypothetical protein